jgi:hypothetical protein
MGCTPSLPKLVECRVWTNTCDPLFIYPELQQDEVPELLSKPNIGIALSGAFIYAVY